jgi:succinate dehydrogenase/fumarate reductase flavoprotein subunit
MPGHGKSRGGVIVVGAGLAGMVAAFHARKKGAEVILIDRGSVGLGTNSSLSNGFFTGPGESYGPDEYVKDTIEIGRHINYEPLVRFVAGEASRAFDFLSSLGLTMAESGNLRSLGASEPHIIPGVTLVKTLAETMRELKGIQIVTGFYVTRILVSHQGVQGVQGFGASGKELVLPASAVVLAAGGAGAIYLRNDNQRNIMGQGYCLAAMAGLDLWDMEFVQFYPLVITGPRLPSMLLYPPYPEEARLINSQGVDIIDKLGLGDINGAIGIKRDEFSVLLFDEARTGPVYMDFTRVPKDLWERHPLALHSKMRFPIKEKPIPVGPGAHFFMGGVRTDEEGQTSIPGLFACGEIEWGLHGANRRGGNALTECIVSGKRAGSRAALMGLTHSASTPVPEHCIEGPSPGLDPGPGQFRRIRQKIRETAWNHAGVVRVETDLRKGLREVESIEAELQSLAPRDRKERVVIHDLTSGAFVLRAILQASLGRQESRGAFIRPDFPREDNAGWRKNSCITCHGREKVLSLSYHEVEKKKASTL